MKAAVERGVLSKGRPPRLLIIIISEPIEQRNVKLARLGARDVQAPPHIYRPFFLQNALFRVFVFLISSSSLQPMPPRTPLGVIDGNRRRSGDLSSSQRGKIISARRWGASWKDAAEAVKCAPTTARSTVRLEPERYDNHSKPKPGRPRLWDERFERRVLRQARINPKITYKDMQDALQTLLLHDTLYRILPKNHITNWLAKK